MSARGLLPCSWSASVLDGQHQDSSNVFNFNCLILGGEIRSACVRAVSIAGCCQGPRTAWNAIEMQMLSLSLSLFHRSIDDR